MSSSDTRPMTPAEAVRWELMDEAIRGFFFEWSIAPGTADRWTAEIVAIVEEHLQPHACTTCEDVGYITVPDHACGGNDRVCAEACPAPTQVRCPECDTEDNQPTGDGEDPF